MFYAHSLVFDQAVHHLLNFLFFLEYDEAAHTQAHIQDDLFDVYL